LLFRLGAKFFEQGVESCFHLRASSGGIRLDHGVDFARHEVSVLGQTDQLVVHGKGGFLRDGLSGALNGVIDLFFELARKVEHGLIDEVLGSNQLLLSKGGVTFHSLDAFFHADKITIELNIPTSTHVGQSIIKEGVQIRPMKFRG
jgi:hypothetical protein